MWLRQISNLERLSVKWHLSCTSLVIIKILQTFLLPHGHVFHILNMFQITWLLFKGILLQSCTNQRWLILQSNAKGKNWKKGNPSTDLLVLKSIFGFCVRLQIRNLMSQLNTSNVYGNESICLLGFSESCKLWSQKFQPTVTFFGCRQSNFRQFPNSDGLRRSLSNTRHVVSAAWRIFCNHNLLLTIFHRNTKKSPLILICLTQRRLKLLTVKRTR